MAKGDNFLSLRPRPEPCQSAYVPLFQFLGTAQSLFYNMAGANVTGQRLFELVHNWVNPRGGVLDLNLYGSVPTKRNFFHPAPENLPSFDTLF